MSSTFSISLAPCLIRRLVPREPADSIAPAAADTTAPAVADSIAPAVDVPAGPLGWHRPLWDPFVPTALGWLSWHTPYLPVSDGGLGAVARILGDAGTSPTPLVLRDGVPLGTGHVLADDPALRGFNWVNSSCGKTIDKIGQDSLAKMVNVFYFLEFMFYCFHDS